MSRNGKIARLPRRVREQLNRRLEDGEPGEPLLAWLNGLPEVGEVLKNQFGGVPINKQSLSQWRLGGYQDWLRHEDACDAVRQLAEQAEALEAEADDQSASEMLAGLLSVELAQSARALLSEAADSKERWHRLRELLAQLAQVRRADHRAARLRLEQERWELEHERLEREEWARKFQSAKDRALAPFWNDLKRERLAEVFGGGEPGEKIADYMIKIHNMHPDDADVPLDPNLARSEAVRPNQTKT